MLELLETVHVSDDSASDADMSSPSNEKYYLLQFPLRHSLADAHGCPAWVPMVKTINRPRLQ
jgi:hypothetical protein